MRCEVVEVAADPGPEAHLVDGAVEGHGRGCLAFDAAGALADESGGGSGEGGKAGREGVRENVYVRGDAPMAEVPDDLGAGGE